MVPIKAVAEFDGSILLVKYRGLLKKILSYLFKTIFGPIHWLNKRASIYIGPEKNAFHQTILPFLFIQSPSCLLSQIGEFNRSPLARPFFEGPFRV